jgi:hypothetical protein
MTVSLLRSFWEGLTKKNKKIKDIGDLL